MLKNKKEQVQLILVRYFKASVCKIVLPQHVINVKITDVFLHPFFPY